MNNANVGPLNYSFDFSANLFQTSPWEYLGVNESYAHCKSYFPQHWNPL